MRVWLAGGLVIVAGLVIVLVVFLSGNEPEPVPVSPTPQQAEAAPGTPTPDELITGRWFATISERRSQEREGVRVAVWQLRLSTPERLLPDMGPAELASMGIDGALSLVEVRIEVSNNTDSQIEFNPVGFDNTLIVNQEQATPVLRLSNASMRIPPGETANIGVMYSLSNTMLRDIRDATYSVRGINFYYTDLIALN